MAVALAPVLPTPLTLPSTLTADTLFRSYCRDDGAYAPSSASLATWLQALSAAGVPDALMDPAVDAGGAEVTFTCTLAQALRLIDEQAWTGGFLRDLTFFLAEVHGVAETDVPATLDLLRARCVTPPTGAGASPHAASA